MRRGTELGRREADAGARDGRARVEEQRTVGAARASRAPAAVTCGAHEAAEQEQSDAEEKKATDKV